MKYLSFTPAVLIAFVLNAPQSALAQWGAQYGTVTQGMFGNQVIGRPSTLTQAQGMFGSYTVGLQRGPVPSTFTNNAQFTPGGFVMSNNQYYGYQSNIPFTTQGNTLDNLVPTGINNAPIVESNYPQGIEPAGAINPNNAPATSAAGAAQQGINAGIATEGVDAGAAGMNAGVAGMNAGVMPGAPGGAITQRLKMRSDLVSKLAQQPSYVRSAKLSDRMTSVADTGRMLSGKAINVYLSNGVALMQGTVRSSNDRNMLGQVLSMEPEVQFVDNRLAPETAGNQARPTK